MKRKGTQTPGFTQILATLDSRGILDVKLNKPDIRNAFNAQVIEELRVCFTKIDPKTRAVVIRGEGPTFCAGGDLNWMRESATASRPKNLKDTKNLSEMLRAVNECPKPVIGLIHGAAMGGGVGLISVCDVAIASQETLMSLSEARLGLIPACIAPFVAAKIGPSHARALFVTAERFGADAAKAMGLIHKIVPRPEDLSSEAERVIAMILDCGPEAVVHAKKLALDLTWFERRAKIKNPFDYVAKLLATLRVSPEGQEGVLAFLEKRKPKWAEKNS